MPSVCFHIAVPEVFGWLDDISDPLLEYLASGKPPSALVPNLRVSNSYTEHATARPLRRHKSTARSSRPSSSLALQKVLRSL